MDTEDLKELKRRWVENDPQGMGSLLDTMVETLQTQCLPGTPGRPVKLDLRGINLAHQDLSGLDLSGYDFSHANLNRADMSRANLSYAVLSHAALEQAVLDECEFIGADLSHADLNECSAKMCGFGGAVLDHASMINATLSDAVLSSSSLRGADLRAADLKQARLSEADLSHAIFTRADLTACDLKNAEVEGTSFELANCQRCRFLGIKSFKKASWIGADIRDMDLRGAYLVRRHIADENYLFEFQSQNRLSRIIYLVWLYTSDCGRSLLRWFVMLLAATLGFAAVYTQVDIDYGDYKTWFSPIYFSFVTLTTLGYGDAVPKSFTAQVFVTLQAVTGYMGLGGLLSILGNKMARRAE